MSHTDTLSPRPAGASDAEVTTTNESTAVAPGTLSTLILAADAEDETLGRQLETQWHHALRGEAEVHIFGAMMIIIHGRLRNVSTRGHVYISHNVGRGSSGKGIEGWLSEYAPLVKRPTALRWMRATEGLLHRTKIADAAALQHLLGTAAADLPEPERLQQLDLFSTLESTSQAELLQSAPIRPRGGARARRPAAADPGRDTLLEEAVELWRPILRALQTEGLEQQSFVNLPDTGAISREAVHGLLTDVIAAMRGAERKVA